MNKLAKFSLSIALAAAVLLTVASTALGDPCDVICCVIDPETGECTGARVCCGVPPDNVSKRDFISDPSPMLFWKTVMDPTSQRITSDNLPKDAQRVLLFNGNEFEVRTAENVIMLIPRMKVTSEVMKEVK